MKDHNSRRAAGLIAILHKGQSIPTSVGSKVYETRYTGVRPPSLTGLKVGKIPSGYEHRPDLISKLFFNSALGWWKVCETNNIFDVFEQLNAGEYIYLPRK